MVALAGPGVEDSVREGVDGVVVRSPGPDSAARNLGDAIATLAGEPERRGAMARDARSGAERFDVSHRIDEVVALYRELLGHAG